jgi:hypothetical protein
MKNAYRKPIVLNKLTRSKSTIALDDDFSFDDEGYIVPEGVSFCDSKVCSAILCNYQDLKFGSEGAFDRDLYYVMHDFDNLLDDALKDYPLYQRITEYKI